MLAFFGERGTGPLAMAIPAEVMAPDRSEGAQIIEQPRLLRHFPDE